MSIKDSRENGQVLRLDRISHNHLKSLDRNRTMVVAAVSPIEVHGPHLPLGQDFMEAYAITEKTLEKVASRHKEWTFVLLPPIPVATDCVPKLGSINFPVSVVRDVAYHLMKPFAMHGFARLAFTAFHGGPRHNCALEAASEKLSKEFNVAVLPLFSAVIKKAVEGEIFFEGIENSPGREITLEQIKHDHHAGFVETSLGLHLWPELIDEGWQELAPEVSHAAPQGKHSQHFLFASESTSGSVDRARRTWERIRAMVRSARHFKAHTYKGYPALSSAVQGRDMFEHLTNVAQEVIEEFLDKGMEMDGHSPLWVFRRVLLSPSVNKVFDDLLGVYKES